MLYEVITDTGNWKEYSSAGNGFTIKYPENFQVITDNKKANAMNYLPLISKSTVVTISRNISTAKKTNLSGAAVTVGILKKFRPASINDEIEKTDDIKINDVTFSGGKGSDAGAGNYAYYETYSAYINKKWYIVSFYISSTNIHNYDPGTVHEFDRDSIMQELKSIMGTFSIIRAKK